MGRPATDFIATEARFGAQNYEPPGVVLSRGQGVWVWDTQGNRYLDDGIEADVTLLGKALSGGFYPVSAVLSNNEVLGILKPGQHGSTFGGNPLACAVARAALRALVEEGMIENAAVQGARFLGGLRSIRANTIREVRGRGLMLAVELHPEAGAARRYCEALQGTGILAKDTHEHTIRIAPPLVITDDQVDWALERISATLRQDFS